MADDTTSRGPATREGEVSAIIKQKVAPAQRDAYEAWLKEIIPVAARCPGHRGVNIIRPHTETGEYTVILHFDTMENLGRWLESGERRQLIDKALFELDFNE
ncbi:MAG TPA: antibiotic biosynthesis monooxygenase, partial [Stellaceae bacterium]|nr:antibiotic biosynthesis monooxygenase [Stellaceae bacterium]